MNIKILYEDKNLLVLNKPAGITVHADGKNKDKTIADWLVAKYPKIKNVGEPFLIERPGGRVEKIERPGIVHRLDKETSGALVVAKDQKTFHFLKEQFQNHQVEKAYRAFVYGSVSEPKASLATNRRGIINVPIGRSPKSFGAFTAGRGAKEPIKESVTEYIILDKFSIVNEESKQKEDYTYIEAYPKTGRTHQIRVHMRFINHPVVSDPIYRGKKEKALGFDRLALHAVSISFNMPNGERKTILAPLPTDFKKAIKANNLKD